MNPPHSKLLRKCVAAEKDLRDSAADQVKRKGKSSAHRGPEEIDRDIELREGPSIAEPCSVGASRVARDTQLLYFILI